MNENNLLKLETRSKIYNLILIHPGLHLSEISRRLDIYKNAADYHLRYLIKNGLIVDKLEGRYRRFYVSQSIGREHMKILNFLRQETPRNIILFLFHFGCGYQNQISEDLEKDPKSIEFHLKKMFDEEIIVTTPKCGIVNLNPLRNRTIERDSIRNEKIYMLKNPTLIYCILVKYQDDIFDKDVNIHILGLFDYLIKNLRNCKIKNPRDSYIRAADAILDLCPIPFCA